MVGRDEKRVLAKLPIPEPAIHDLLKHVLGKHFLHRLHCGSGRFADFGPIQAVYAQHWEYKELVSIPAGVQPSRDYDEIHSLHLGGASTHYGTGIEIYLHGLVLV